MESLETYSKATVRRLFFAMIPDFRCFSLKLASQHEISFQAAQMGYTDIHIAESQIQQKAA